MPQIHCFVPIRVRIVGRPNGAQLEELAEALAQAVRARIAEAEHAISTEQSSPGGVPTSEPVQEAALPSRLADSTYEIPSFDQEGRRKRVPVRSEDPSRRSRGRGPRSGSVRVRWSDAWEDFYHNLVEGVARRFGVPEAALWVPFRGPGRRFHSEHPDRFELQENQWIRIRVGFHYDPEDVPGAGGVVLEAEAAERTAPAPAPAPRPRPGRRPAGGQAGRRSGSIRVRWSSEWEEFYHHLVEAVAESFGVPEAELWVPFHGPGRRFHSEHPDRFRLKEGQWIRVTVAFDHDPEDVPGASNVRLETPPEAPPVPAPAPAAAGRLIPSEPPPTASDEREDIPPPARLEPTELDPLALALEEEGTYPRDFALFCSWLIRSGYIEQVSNLLPAAWRTMSEAELTAWLTKRFTEAEIKEMFLEKYTERASVKARFRKYNVVAAIVVGFLWARENIQEGEWGTAAAKVGGAGFGAWVLNRLLYARDPSAAALMANRAGAFGRWFRSAAKTNRFVNFLSRRVAGALLLWDLKDLFMSGGLGGPNIPFDLITEIDLDDPTTWVEPEQTLLDFGFNLWYRQKCTPDRPEACGATPVYLGKIEGSTTWGLLKVLDIAPHEVPEIRRNLYRVEGTWEESGIFGIVTWGGKELKAEDNVLVVATGRRSGQMVSGRGHYRELEVKPANEAAVNLFGSKDSRFVPGYLLHKVE